MVNYDRTEKFNTRKEILKTKNEKRKYPVSTANTHIKDKSIDYRAYLLLLKISTFNVNESYRYITFDNYFYSKNNMPKILDLSYSNAYKILNKVMMSDLVELDTNDDNEILIFKVLDKDFVTLNKTEINKLVSCKNNEIKTYLILKRILFNNSHRFVELSYIADCIGISKTNVTKTIKKYIEHLQELGLIKFEYFYILKDNIRVKRYKFSLK